MVNKKGVWFLSLFSIILILSVYYITMPTELLISNNEEQKENTKPTIKQEESSILVALRIEEDENKEKEIESLKKIISDSDSSIADKNTAFEKMKELSSNRSQEEILEEKIKATLNLKSFIKIDDKTISVTIDNKKHNAELANKIMRTIQEEYQEQMKITVKFQK